MVDEYCPQCDEAAITHKNFACNFRVTKMGRWAPKPLEYNDTGDWMFEEEYPGVKEGKLQATVDVI